MTLKTHFACLSLSASVDQQTGNLSVFDVLEEIRVPQLPVHLQTLVISVILSKNEPRDFQGKMVIHLLTPDGKQQVVGNGEIQVPSDQRRMKAIFRFGGFPVSQFGAHRFVLSWLSQENAKVGETLLDFDVLQVAQVAQAMDQSDRPGITH